ncbi:hypothetical protein [Micromonospora sp. NPDC005203]|uniref:hypothetical protein n=1 Tax=Micromonospora sp. NPDC005203 TaxID=3364226 RepID=UPI0036BD6505
MTRHAVRAARMFDGERLVDGGVLVLLVVDGDPTDDITVLRRPLAVYRAGVALSG